MSPDLEGKSQQVPTGHFSWTEYSPKGQWVLDKNVSGRCFYYFICRYRYVSIHNICTYTHIYIHTYVHTYIYTRIHIYIHTYVHTYIYTYVYTLTSKCPEIQSLCVVFDYHSWVSHFHMPESVLLYEYLQRWRCGPRPRPAHSQVERLARTRRRRAFGDDDVMGCSLGDAPSQTAFPSARRVRPEDAGRRWRSGAGGRRTPEAD